jgi:transposase
VVRNGAAVRGRHADPASPYAPDHDPTERVWNQVKGAVANIQPEAADDTSRAFELFIKNRTFKYDFEHLTIPMSNADFV